MSTTEVSEEAGARRRVPWRRLWPLGVVALVALGWGAVRWWEARQPYVWSGTVEARDVTVGSRVGGRVEAVHAREGQVVEAGAPLVTIDPSELDARRLQAEGELEKARAELAKLERGSRPEEIAAARARAEAAAAELEKATRGPRAEEIARQRSTVAAAEAKLRKAGQDADRAQQLVKSDAATVAELQAAEAALAEARAQRNAELHKLEELRRGSRREDIEASRADAEAARATALEAAIGPRVEEILAQRGAVRAAEGRLEQIRVDLRELVIRAPARARIESLDLRPGDLLAPNAPAATLLEPDELYVRIFVPETQLGLVQPGERVQVRVDTFPDRRFAGRVEYIASQGEYTPRNLQTADERANQVFAMRVNLVEGRDVLRAGMAAFVEVPRG